MRSIVRGWAGRVVVGAAAVAVIGATIVAPRIAAGPEGPQLRTTPVRRATVVETIEISGSVNAAGELRLAFESAGRLAQLLVKVGDAVVAGQPLARLDTSDLELDVRQAEADLASAQARYDRTRSGADPEDVAIARNSVDSAIQSYQRAQRTTAAAVAGAEAELARVAAEHATARAKLDATLDALTTLLDDHVAGIEAVHADALAVRDALEAIMRPGDIETARDQINEADLALTTAEQFLGAALAPARADFDRARDALLAAADAFDRAVAAGADTLGEEQAFDRSRAAFDAAAAALSTAADAATGELVSAQSSLTSARETLSSPESLPLTLLAEEREDLAAAQTSLLAEEQRAPAVKAAIAQATKDAGTIAGTIAGAYADALEKVDDARDGAESTLAQEQQAIRSAELSLAKTTRTPAQADIASAYASLLSAQVSLDRAQATLESATLVATGAGIVTAIAAQVGERVAGVAETFLTIAQTGTLTVQGTVGETEVARLAVGQMARVTIEAIGADVAMTGRVSAVDPVATIEQGVPVYGVDVEIDHPAPAIRAGMSGTAAVLVARAQNVLTVPNLAIRRQDGRRFVQVLREGKIEDATVAFGISNDTVTEVKEGLAEGDEVLLPQPRAGATPQLGGPPAGGGVRGAR